MTTFEDMAVGLVGLGNLGRAMALNLLRRGWRLRVIDTAAERQRHLLENGATATDAAGLADCGIICFAVPDEKAIWLTLRSGLLQRLQARHTVIVHSTVLPSAVREIADAVRTTGARLLDVPVSGGAERAERGQLTLFVGADPADVETARPLLNAIGDRIFPLGPVGSGAAVKLANQLVTFTSLSGLYEALALAGAEGVGERAALEAIGTGTGDTWAGRHWGFFDRLVPEYDLAKVPPESRPWSKDLREILAAGHSAGLELQVARIVAQTVTGQLERHAALAAGGQGGMVAN